MISDFLGLVIEKSQDLISLVSETEEKEVLFRYQSNTMTNKYLTSAAGQMRWTRQSGCMWSVCYRVRTMYLNTMYVNHSTDYDSRKSKKRIHLGSAKARLHRGYSITDLLVCYLLSTYCFLPMKQMMAASTWLEAATYILELNKQNVWEGTRKEEKSMSK